ncbi:unnamed protein product, partial [Polarella glacialis]
MQENISNASSFCEGAHPALANPAWGAAEANKIADLEKARAASEEAATLVAAKSATLEVKLSELTEKAATDTAELQRSLKEEVCPIGAFSEHKAAAAKAVEDLQKVTSTNHEDLQKAIAGHKEEVSKTFSETTAAQDAHK